MTDVNVTRFVLKGIPSTAMSYTRLGQTLLDNLLGAMKFQDLKQGMSQMKLDDGTEIKCQSIFGQHKVTITTGAVEGGEKKVYTTLQGATDRYLLVYGSGDHEYTSPGEEESVIQFLIFDPFNISPSKRLTWSIPADRLRDHEYKSRLEVYKWMQGTYDNWWIGLNAYNEVLVTQANRGWARFSSVSCRFAEFPSLMWTVNLGESSILYELKRPSAMTKVFKHSTGVLIDEFVLRGYKTNFTVLLDGVSTFIYQFIVNHFAIEHLTGSFPDYIKTVKVSQAGEIRGVPIEGYPQGLFIGYIKIVTTIGTLSNGSQGILSKVATTITDGEQHTIATDVDGVSDKWYIINPYLGKWEVITSVARDSISYLDSTSALNLFYPLDIQSYYTTLSYKVDEYYQIGCRSDGYIKFLDTQLIVGDPGVCLKHFIPMVSHVVGKHSALLSIASHTKALQGIVGYPESYWFDDGPATGETREIYIQYPTKTPSKQELTIENPGGTEDVSLKAASISADLGSWINITTDIAGHYFDLTGDTFDFQKLFGIFLYKD